VTGTPTAAVPRISEPVISTFSGISSGAWAVCVDVASPACAGSAPDIVNNDVVPNSAASLDLALVRFTTTPRATTGTSGNFAALHGLSFPSWPSCPSSRLFRDCGSRVARPQPAHLSGSNRWPNELCRHVRKYVSLSFRDRYRLNITYNLSIINAYGTISTNFSTISCISAF
jgi:hypothetical protein